jgi:hypothetical protein
MITESAISLLCFELKIPADWLRNLIKFESKWNPLAKNPLSGARGLIQFTHTTARALGYTNADDIVSKYPGTAEQLLGPVRAYFRLPGNQGPYPTKQSFYMSVFYPAARGWSPEKVFPANVQRFNPGIVTVKDYINKVEGVLAKSGYTALVIAGAILIYFLTSKKGRFL